MNVLKSSQLISHIIVELKTNILEICVAIIIVDVGNDSKLLIYVSVRKCNLINTLSNRRWNQIE
jgi:hypothetical protein